MRKIVLGMAPFLLAASGGAMASPPGWSVSEVNGNVRVTENGRSRAATRGALLSSGATIATGRGSRAVIVRGQEFVVISPSSQLRVPVAAESRGGIMQMIEDFGTALFRIERKSTPHFGVQTPYLAAVVKGTTFTVTVGAEGGSVQVTEGSVEVATLDGGAAELITAGVIAQVGAGDLYQLSVEGETSRTVRSTNAPAAGVVTSSLGSAPVAAYSGPVTESVVVAAASENPQSLSDTTHGLVAGDAAVQLAALDLRAPAPAAPSVQPAPPAVTAEAPALAAPADSSSGPGASSPPAHSPVSGNDSPAASAPPVDIGTGAAAAADPSPPAAGGNANDGNDDHGKSDKDAEKAAKEAEKAAREAGDAAREAAEDAARAAEKAAKDAEKAAKDAEKAEREAAEHAAKAAEEAAKNAEKAAREAAEAAAKAAEEAAKNAEKAAHDAAEDAAKAAEAAEKAAREAAEDAAKAAEEAAKAAERAAREAAEQAANAVVSPPPAAPAAPPVIGDDDDDDDNSGHGSSGSDDDDDNSGSGHGSDDDDDKGTCVLGLLCLGGDDDDGR